MRTRPKTARVAVFGLGLATFAIFPNDIGYQDIGALLARQPGVAERWQKRVFSNSVAAIQVATFSFGRPIGTATPETANYRLASLGDQGVDLAALGRPPLARAPRRYEQSEFPTVDRTLKGDRLAILPPPATAAPEGPDQNVAADAPADAFLDNQSVAGAKTAETSAAPPDGWPLDPDLAEALRSAPLTPFDISLSLEADPLHTAPTPAEAAPHDAAATAPVERPAFGTANLFFGATSLGATLDPLERWADGAAPLIVTPSLVDPDMKAAIGPAGHGADVGGESIAGKGEVNADNQKAKTPAERLGLFNPQVREKQEKCLADAVYFEARGEAVRGQIAVAQVVMNRAFSGYYPATPCGVVYQNAHRHLSCQFTFACDGIRDVVKEPDMWDRARRIAKETLDGRLWLPEVGKSTHYHASWVRPSWVREMKKLYRTGVHTFYRPRNWGDGADSPSWGTEASTNEISATLAAVKP